jgi:Membrane magnesium transporter
VVGCNSEYTPGGADQVPTMVLMSQSLLVVGCVLIVHAAYSLQHFRSLVKDLVESSTGVSLDVEDDSSLSSSVDYRMPPLDVWIELGIAFVILLTSELTRSGSSFPMAIVKKGDALRCKNLIPSVMAAPFMSRDYDIYTTRKSKI